MPALAEGEVNYADTFVMPSRCDLTVTEYIDEEEEYDDDLEEDVVTIFRYWKLEYRFGEGRPHVANYYDQSNYTKRAAKVHFLTEYLPMYIEGRRLYYARNGNPTR